MCACDQDQAEVLLGTQPNLSLLLSGAIGGSADLRLRV